jgi:hypothetical protein|tara:strand:+ start:747 stop:950 length:204 start_codon:yes stop_codon:yes gene_type:complete
MAHLRIQQQLDDNLRRQTAFAYKIQQNKHATHDLDVEKSTTIHGDKVVCKTCNKFVAWIPKAITETI